MSEKITSKVEDSCTDEVGQRIALAPEVGSCQRVCYAGCIYASGFYTNCSYIFSTHLFTVRSGFRLVSSCAVNAYFTGFAAYLIFYLCSSKIDIFQKNGVVRQR